MSENCIFCKIINGQINSPKLYEDENMIIIKDINPIAPIHLLAIVKKHYALLSEQTQEDSTVVGEMLNKISRQSDRLGLVDGYRLIINQGEHGGQTVKHLHIHVLGGKSLNWNNL